MTDITSLLETRPAWHAWRFLSDVIQSRVTCTGSNQRWWRAIEQNLNDGGGGGISRLHNSLNICIPGPLWGYMLLNPSLLCLTTVVLPSLTCGSHLRSKMIVLPPFTHVHSTEQAVKRKRLHTFLSFKHVISSIVHRYPYYLPNPITLEGRLVNDVCS